MLLIDTNTRLQQQSIADPTKLQPNGVPTLLPPSVKQNHLLLQQIGKEI
jgi:hypothetical protein